MRKSFVYNCNFRKELFLIESYAIDFMCILLNSELHVCSLDFPFTIELVTATNVKFSVAKLK